MKNIIMRNNRAIHHRRILLILIMVSGFLSGCSAAAKTSTYDVHSEITGEEKDQILGTAYNRLYEKVERGNEKQDPTILSAIYLGGKDATVPEGRYVITGSQGGLITILDADGNVWLKEALLGDHITVSLLDTDTVHADAGFDEYVSIKKAEEWTEPFLTTGTWEVGVDIEPGTYKFYSEGGYGFIQIYEAGTSPRLYEIIGGVYDEERDIVNPNIYKEITVTEGQQIRVTGTTVKYEK